MVCTATDFLCDLRHTAIHSLLHRAILHMLLFELHWDLRLRHFFNPCIAIGSRRRCCFDSLQVKQLVPHHGGRQHRESFTELSHLCSESTFATVTGLPLFHSLHTKVAETASPDKRTNDNGSEEMKERGKREKTQLTACQTCHYCSNRFVKPPQEIILAVLHILSVCPDLATVLTELLVQFIIMVEIM